MFSQKNADMFPVVHSSEEVLPSQVSDDLSILAVILAAGQSERYGSKNKLLEQINDTTLISHVIDATQRSLVSGTIVVTGYEHEKISEVVDDRCKTVVNDQYAQGQSTSVACGINAAQTQNADAALILLGDMPEVSAKSINKLVNAYDATNYTILAAAFNGERGNPVLFGRKHFNQLCNVTGDIGGRNLILDNENAALTETNDPGTLLDIDRPEEIMETTRG